MAREHIPSALRRRVIQRAFELCEYCLVPVAWVAVPHHVDHIVSLKHGGTTVEENLAYACFECNLAKGTDIAARDPLTNQLVPLFHPRLDQWSAHFTCADAHIIGLSAIGRATVQLLRFNDEARVRQRGLLIAANIYPTKLT